MEGAGSRGTVVDDARDSVTDPSIVTRLNSVGGPRGATVVIASRDSKSHVVILMANTVTESSSGTPS